MKHLLTRCLAGLLLTICLGAQSSAEETEDPFPKFDKPPQMKRAVQPAYPYNMRRAGLEGAVDIEYVVTADGKVAEAFVVESNNPWFERPAIDAVLKWQFTPAMKDGRAVNSRVQQKVTFSLYGGGESLWAVERRKKMDQLPPEFRWDKPPVAQHSMFPNYPFPDLLAGRTGLAKVKFVIDPHGRVVGSAIDSATTPEMGAAALAAIDAWRFLPARKADDTACYAALSIEFEFDPGSGDAPVTDSARSILRDLRRGGKAIAELNTLDAAPKPLSRRPPAYPSSLERAGRPGEATIEFFIDERGDAQLPRVVSADSPEFGYAAAQAVGTWRFQPPRKEGKPVVVRAQVPVNFSLKEESK